MVFWKTIHQSSLKALNQYAAGLSDSLDLMTLSMTSEESLPVSAPPEDPSEKPNQFERLYNTGNYLLQSHQSLLQPANLLEQAIDTFSRALEINPDCLKSQSKLALLFLQKGHYTKAVKLAQKTFHQDPTQPEAAYVLGYVHLKNGQPTQGIPYLQQALASKNPSTIGRHQLYFLLATMHKARQDRHTPFKNAAYWVQSLSCNLQGFIQSDGIWKQAYLKQQTLMGQLVLGYDPLQAQTTFDKLFTLYQQYPGYVTLQTMIGDLFHSQGIISEALYWYRKAISRAPLHEPAYFKLAETLEELGEFDLALETYQQLHQLLPNHEDLCCHLGNVLYRMGHYEEALRHYQKALRQSRHNDWKVLLCQSIAKIYYEHLGQVDAARMTLEMALDLNPTHVDTYIQLGLILFEAHAYESGIDLYEKALRQFPDNPQLYASMAYLKWLQDDLEGAITDYKKALSTDPTYEIAYNNLGVIYLDSFGYLQQAADYFEKALTQNDQYAVAYYNLGRVASLQDKNLEAAHYFKQAQTINKITGELDQMELENRIFNLFQHTEN